MTKPVGRHPEKALTAVQVRAFKQPGRYADGNGLYLVVDASGAKRWLLRTVVQGRRRDIGLGGLSLVSLAEAREAALTFRKVARAGGDPIADRSKARAVVPTFAEAAESVHAEHQRSWKNAKHQAQWISTIKTYATPIIGEMRIDQIETPDILKVLSPIWLTKPETARRLRQRLGVVMDWAKTAGHRSGENPVSGVAKGLPKQQDRAVHHRALPYSEVPGFMTALRSGGTTASRLALEFLILTATRTGETLGARWEEVSFEQAVWTIPADRMKAGRPHRVPLTERAVGILKIARAQNKDGKWVFATEGADKPLSNMALLALLKRMKLDVTTHGFRSSFRDWASETTNFPREVAEMALAHTIESKVEAAYRRGDLIEKRRELMTAWSIFNDC